MNIRFEIRILGQERFWSDLKTDALFNSLILYFFIFALYSRKIPNTCASCIYGLCRIQSRSGVCTSDLGPLIIHNSQVWENSL